MVGSEAWALTAAKPTTFSSDGGLCRFHCCHNGKVTQGLGTAAHAKYYVDHDYCYSFSLVAAHIEHPELKLCAVLAILGQSHGQRSSYRSNECETIWCILALYAMKCCIFEINNFSDDKQIATSLHELIVIFFRCRMTTRRGFQKQTKSNWCWAVPSGSLKVAHKNLTERARELCAKERRNLQRLERGAWLLACPLGLMRHSQWQKVKESYLFFFPRSFI